MSAFVSPMLAKASSRERLDLGDWDGYVLEPKHDGMRAIAVRTEDGVTVFSRSGKIYTDHVPHLVKEFIWHLPVGTVLDGELAMIKEANLVQGQMVPVVDFNKTMRIMGGLADRAVRMQEQGKWLAFLLFDIVRWGHEDLSSQPWSRRREIMDDNLGHLATDSQSSIWPNPVYESQTGYADLYDELIDNGIEGAILKRKAAPYVAGKRPNKTWYKVKAEQTFDVVVMGFTDAVVADEDKKGWRGLIGAVKFGAYDENGELKYVGRCSGMDDETRRAWTEIRNQADAAGLPVSYYGHVIEVKANEMVGSGQYRTPRHPQYVMLREDKKAAECLMAQFKVEE